MGLWDDVVRRGTTGELRKEDIGAEFKNAIEKAARKYVDDIFNTMLQSGCSLDVIKHCYPVVVSYYDNSIMIYDLLDKDEYSDFSYDDVKEWDLGYYPKVAIRQYAKEVILALENDGKEVEVKKTSRPIDYPALKDILRYLFEKNSRVAANPLLRDLCGRSLNIFEFVYNEICADADLKQLENEDNIDAIVDRVVELLSKYEGIDIPAPYEDIDDWWGDFNSTINYLADAYDSERRADMRVKELEKSYTRQAGPHKCVAVISQIGPAKKTAGFYTNDKKPIRFDAEHQKSLRWHQHYVELKDDSWDKNFPGWSFGVAVVTKVGDTGEKIVKEAINEVVKKYGGFKCYTCEKWSFELSKYVPAKNKKMIAEIRDILEKHNLKMAGVLNED